MFRYALVTLFVCLAGGSVFAQDPAPTEPVVSVIELSPEEKQLLRDQIEKEVRASIGEESRSKNQVAIDAAVERSLQQAQLLEMHKQLIEKIHERNRGVVLVLLRGSHTLLLGAAVAGTAHAAYRLHKLGNAWKYLYAAGFLGSAYSMTKESMETARTYEAFRLAPEQIDALIENAKKKEEQIQGTKIALLKASSDLSNEAISDVLANVDRTVSDAMERAAGKVKENQLENRLR